MVAASEPTFQRIKSLYPAVAVAKRQPVETSLGGPGARRPARSWSCGSMPRSGNDAIAPSARCGLLSFCTKLNTLWRAEEQSFPRLPVYAARFGGNSSKRDHANLRGIRRNVAIRRDIPGTAWPLGDPLNQEPLWPQPPGPFKVLADPPRNACCFAGFRKRCRNTRCRTSSSRSWSLASS
jgi:hypothetical protein